MRVQPPNNPYVGPCAFEEGTRPLLWPCPWHKEERHYAPPEEEISTEATPLVYHLLGHLDDPESLVISEDDYFLLNVN